MQMDKSPRLGPCILLEGTYTAVGKTSEDRSSIYLLGIASVVLSIPNITNKFSYLGLGKVQS